MPDRKKEYQQYLSRVRAKNSGKLTPKTLSYAQYQKFVMDRDKKASPNKPKKSVYDRAASKPPAATTRTKAIKRGLKKAGVSSTKQKKLTRY